MKNRITDRGVTVKSQALAGKRIAVGVCGGIAAVEVVKLFRELRRLSAEVFAFATPSTLAFVSELSLSWAAGRPAICSAESEAYHLDPFDFTLVAPATANTIAKCAAGISDNAVTLLVASQLGGGKPVAFVPTMNLVLRNHPAYGENVKRLTGWGARFYPELIEEGRLKFPDPEQLAQFVAAGCG